MTLPCPICAAAAPGPRVCGYCGAHQPSAADIAHVAAIGRATLRATLAPSPAEEAAAGDRVAILSA